MSNNCFNMNIDNKLICDFLAIFSRMEFALKASIKYADGNEKGISADWDAFAKDYASFIEKDDCELEKAIDYLFANAPKKQVLKDGELKFILTNNTERTTNQLLILVRRVRNNLFHGGKYHPNDEGRDELLIVHTLKILEKCVQLDDNVYRLYRKV